MGITGPRARPRSRRLVVAVGIIAVATGSACAGEDDGLTPDQARARRIDQEKFNAKAEALAARASVFVPTTLDGVFRTSAKRLFVAQADGAEARLKSYTDDADSPIDYAFPAGTADTPRFRESDTLVAVVGVAGGEIKFHEAYAASSKDHVLGELAWPAPTEAEIWPHHTDGTAVWLLKADPEWALYRWQPGSEPTKELTLADAGVALSSHPAGYDGLYVAGTTALVQDDTQLVAIDLASKRASRLGTASLSALARRPNGVVYRPADGAPSSLVLHTFSDGATTDLASLIESDRFAITPTHVDAHKTVVEFAWNGEELVYSNGLGVFSLNVHDETLVPLLLNPDPEILGGAVYDRQDFESVQVLEDGTTFVRARSCHVDGNAGESECEPWSLVRVPPG